jgi:hypothetical protein
MEAISNCGTGIRNFRFSDFGATGNLVASGEILNEKAVVRGFAKSEIRNPKFLPGLEGCSPLQPS